MPHPRKSDSARSDDARNHLIVLHIPPRAPLIGNQPAAPRRRHHARSRLALRARHVRRPGGHPGFPPARHPRPSGCVLFPFAPSFTREAKTATHGEDGA